MKRLGLFLTFMLTSCSSLSTYEQNKLVEMNSYGITINDPKSDWKKPASPAVAGSMNILSGMGNFYLAHGDAADGDHFTYGVLNLMTFPISWVWSIPEAAIDANNINKRDMVWYYTHDRKGKAEYERIKAEIESSEQAAITGAKTASK